MSFLQRVVTQVASRHVPITAPKIQSQVNFCGIIIGQTHTGAGLSTSTKASHTNPHSNNCSISLIYHPDRHNGILKA
jgi:hypothetical protein